MRKISRARLENFPPEFRLLLTLLRSALSPETKPALETGPIDGKKFIATVERHRVGAFLVHRAPKQLAALCPESVVRRLQIAANNATRRALTQAAEQIRLLRCLKGAGIETLSVKGLVLGQQLFGTIGVRHVGDIDLMVRPSDALRADAVLQEAGLRRTRPDFALTPRQAREFLRVKPEFEYRRDTSAHRIELLWRLEGLPGTESPWSNSVSCVVGGHPLRTIAPDLNAIYLCQHGARHGWFRLFWLVDAAVLLRDPNLDWDSVMTRARQLDLERALLQTASLSEELLDVPCPSALQPATDERANTFALCAEARRQITRDAAQHEDVGEWARQLSYRARLQKTARAKFFVLAPHLFSPESWRILPLPDRWFFLYYFATPFLWLWRRMRRSA